FLYGKALYRGRGQTLQNAFAMVACGAESGDTTHDRVYPGVMMASQTSLPKGRIVGEVYEVGDKLLERLDKMEGVGINYDRIEVSLTDGTKAQMYVKRPD